jgi:hypothetical protein
MCEKNNSGFQPSYHNMYTRKYFSSICMLLEARGSVVGRATRRKVTGSSPDDVHIFNLPNPPSRATRPTVHSGLTEMCTVNHHFVVEGVGGNGWPAHKADNLTAICRLSRQNVEALSHRPTGPHGLLKGYLYLSLHAVRVSKIWDDSIYVIFFVSKLISGARCFIHLVMAGYDDVWGLWHLCRRALLEQLNTECSGKDMVEGFDYREIFSH